MMLKDLEWRGKEACRFAQLRTGGMTYMIYHYGDSEPARRFNYVNHYSVRWEREDGTSRLVSDNVDALTVQCWLNTLPLEVSDAAPVDD